MDHTATEGRTLSVTELEWSGLGWLWGEGDAGQEFGSVLDAFESVAHDVGQVVHVGDGEVAQAAFDV